MNLRGQRLIDPFCPAFRPHSLPKLQTASIDPLCLYILLAGSVKGVDSTACSSDALGHAMQLARDHGCVVAVSGAVDYVSESPPVPPSYSHLHALIQLSWTLWRSARPWIM